MSQQSSPERAVFRSDQKSSQIKEHHETSIEVQRRPTRVIVSTNDQIRDFLVFELAHAAGRGVKRDYRDWYESYLKWADIHSIEQMPQCVFLRLLSKASGVEKKIARLKDPLTGRVVKNDAGTPVRVYSYILGGPAPTTKGCKRETPHQRMNREISELEERRRLAALTPEQSWPEYLASIPEHERSANGLQDLYRKMAV
jgi:hypothetical protein